jgi:TPR repeat protein
MDQERRQHDDYSGTNAFLCAVENLFMETKIANAPELPTQQDARVADTTGAFGQAKGPMKRVTLILTALVSLLVSSLPGSPLPASRPSPGKQALASSTPFAADWLAEATRYFNAKDYARAMPFLRKGAETGNTYAMTNLGYLYRNGLGVTQDYDQARQWFQKAAKAGYPDAMTDLGELYQNGLGVTQDYDQARQWFQKAAKAGNAYAMTNLGYLYRNGLGVTQDYGQARQWYQKAAEGGNADAMSSLGEMYRDGQGVTQDYGQARQWFQKAANAGDDEAKQALARLQADSK